MSRFRILAVLIAVATAGLFIGPVFASTATKTKTVAFSGKYAGTATLLINNSSVTISSITGTGTATPSLLGASAVSGSGSGAASAQCDPFGGKGSITGKSSKITFTVTSSTSQGCSSGQSGPVTVTFKGVAKATGGSGKAKGATGSLKFSGSLNLGGTSGTQSGHYSVTLSGKLTVDVSPSTAL